MSTPTEYPKHIPAPWPWRLQETRYAYELKYSGRLYHFARVADAFGHALIWADDWACSVSTAMILNLRRVDFGPSTDNHITYYLTEEQLGDARRNGRVAGLTAEEPAPCTN